MELEYYSATKKKEILPFATTWMDIEGVILNEVTQITQREKDKPMISLICGIFKKKKTKPENNQTHRKSNQICG